MDITGRGHSTGIVFGEVGSMVKLVKLAASAGGAAVLLQHDIIAEDGKGAAGHYCSHGIAAGH